MKSHALTKILADVQPHVSAAEYAAAHLERAGRHFRAAFQRYSTAELARQEGDKETAKYFEAWADTANERGERHLDLAVRAQRSAA